MFSLQDKSYESRQLCSILRIETLESRGRQENKKELSEREKESKKERETFFKNVLAEIVEGLKREIYINPKLSV